MSKPVRLAKETDIPTWVEFLNRYSPYIVMLLIIILMILIIAVIVSIAQMGGANMTMVESGNYYYHLQDVI